MMKLKKINLKNCQSKKNQNQKNEIKYIKKKIWEWNYKTNYILKFISNKTNSNKKMWTKTKQLFFQSIYNCSKTNNLEKKATN